MQLDLLLRSIEKFTDIEQQEILVYYNYSSHDFERGYKKVLKYNFVFPIKQRGFYQDVKDIFECLNLDKRIVIICDDYVFTRPINIAGLANLLDNPLINSILLYMSANIIQNDKGEWINCHREIYDTPIQHTKWLISSHNRKSSWGCYNPIAASIHRASWLKFMINHSRFSCPNSLEGAINRKWWRWGARPYSAAPVMSSCIHIHQNQVQTISPQNVVMKNGLSAKELNDIYLSGKRIKPDNIYGINNMCETVPIKFEFEDD